MRTAPLAFILTIIPPAVAACGNSGEATTLKFIDVSDTSGVNVKVVCGDPRRWYIPESNGSGVAWLDYDGDGDMDLFMANGSGVKYIDDGARLEIQKSEGCKLYAKLWSEDHDALIFRDVTKAANAGCDEWINGVAVGDVDNDGDPDLFLAGVVRSVFLRNEGGKFVDATQSSGLINPYWGASAAFGDVDNDGDLDLYVANYCIFDPEHPPAGGKRNVINGVEVGWGPEKENPGINVGAPDLFFLNDGKGVFTEATKAAGLELTKALCSYAVVFSDVDGDGFQDILVANDGQPSNLFHNKGLGKYKEEGVERGFAYDAHGRATSAMGLAVDDFDGDGDMDVYRSNFDQEANSLLVNDGTGHFTDMAEQFGLAAPSMDRLGWACAFFDADNDGDLDLVVANGHVYPQSEQIGMSPWTEVSQLYECVKTGAKTLRYVDRSAELGAPFAMATAARGIAVGDPNNDGLLDLVITDIDKPPRVIRNMSERKGHFLSVRLIGRLSNRDGYGARVTVTAGGKRFVHDMNPNQGLYSSHDPRLHFGLGGAERIRSVSVKWPSGVEQTVSAPDIDTFLTIRETSDK